MQMIFGCCPGSLLRKGKASPTETMPEDTWPALEGRTQVRHSRRAPAFWGRVGKFGREETVFFAWSYQCAMISTVSKSQSKLEKMTRNFGALNFPHGKGKSVIFLMSEERIQ